MTPASPDEKQTSAFASGAVVGAYRIESEIGRGGMGVVYKAIHTVLNKPVAMKVMGVAFSANEQAIARLMAEGRALAKLQHPNVVSITDCGEFNGLPYLVLEYLEGGTVEGWLQRSGGRLPVADVRRVLQDALAGLQAAHEAQIVHRDLKPSNFLIDAQGRIRISDFGLAQAFQGGDVTVVDRTIFASSPTVTSFGPSRSSSTGPVGGTVQFMAPELHGGSQGDARSDIFAIGVMTYYLLTGRKPAGKFIEASKLLPGLPRSWDLFIDKCIAQQPDDRFQSAAAALAALPAAGRRGGGKTWIVLAAAVLAVGLGVGAWWQWGRETGGGGLGGSQRLTEPVRFSGFQLGDQVLIEGRQSIVFTSLNIHGADRTLSTRKTRVAALRQGVVLFDREFDFSKEEQRVVDLGSLVQGTRELPAAVAAPAASPAEAPSTVEIRIVNVPPDHEVAIGDRVLPGAGANPVHMALPTGRAELRLLRQGKVLLSQTIDIRADAEPIDAGALLAMAGCQVEVRFEGPAVPADAEVWVDDVCRAAPGPDGKNAFVPLMPGRHIVELRGRGLQRTTATVEVVERQSAVVHLEVAYQEFELALNGLPDGATGTIGGRPFSADATGTVRLKVRYGRQPLAIEAPMREPFRQDVDVTSSVTLAPALAWRTQFSISMPGGGNIDVRRIDAGEYRVGSRAGDARRQITDLRERTVLVAGCYMARTELTRGQYEAIMEADNTSPATRGAGKDLPVSDVSGRDLFKSAGFLARLNGHLAAAGLDLVADLPTEDEWEVACLARDATEAAPLAGDAGPYPVNGLPANGWGFCGMLGNVAELTRPAAAVGMGADTRLLVLRGGSWQSGPGGQRPQARREVQDDLRLPTAGLRLVFRNRSETPRAATPAAH